MDLGRIFLKHGLLTSAELAPLCAQGEKGRLDRQVIERGMATEEQVLRALAQEFGLRYVDAASINVDPQLLATFSPQEIFRHRVFPIERQARRVVLATSDPLNLEAFDELAAATGLELEPAVMAQPELQRLIKSSLGVGGGTVETLVSQAEADPGVASHTGTQELDASDASEQASVVKLVNELLLDAVEQWASDIHLELEEKGLTIRYRVDGLLRLEPAPPAIHQLRAAIVSRLKIMAGLNIAEKRLPQDGRIKLRLADRDIDVRVSVIPMLHGEGIVLRLLDKGRLVFDLDQLDLPARLAPTFRKLIGLPHGIVLVTGPTGSGKTTTLYSALATIRNATTKIITIEDPVEYNLPGISQIQIHSKIGLTFAAGLRSILRHDPDVILVGEVRDSETAQAAIQSALTGHLVFSTLHTNDACGAYTRLVEMGIEPYLVASTIEGVLAQRLVRRLCTSCRVPHACDNQLPADFPRERAGQLFRAGGCKHCHGTGYRGRIAIFELLRTDAGLRRLCLDRAAASDIRSYASQQGFLTLRANGWERVLEGLTTVDEVLRVSTDAE
jgi:general secretion pathway protein E/type IV pilus assembly protein PilB